MKVSPLNGYLVLFQEKKQKAAEPGAFFHIPSYSLDRMGEVTHASSELSEYLGRKFIFNNKYDKINLGGQEVYLMKIDNLMLEIHETE